VSAMAAEIVVPQAQIKALHDAMKYAGEKLDMDAGEAVKFGGWAVASSCAAATNVAKQYRSYIQRRKPKTTKTGKKPGTWRVKFDGTGKEYFVNAGSIGELKRHRAVVIFQRGLAKAAWLWNTERASRAAMASGAPKYDNRITVNAKRVAGKFGAVEFGGTRNDPWMRVSNKLQYAMDALKNGQSSIADATGKAARRMVTIINAKVKARLREQGLK